MVSSSTPTTSSMLTTPVPPVANTTVDNATTAGTTTSPAVATPAKTMYHTMKEPPIPTGKYSPKDAMEDIPRAQYAINLFMASAMVESQEYIRKADPKMQRLFLATGYGVIQAVRAMMSFEDADLLSAQEDAKHGLTVAASHRKKAPNFTSRLAGFVTGAASGTAWIKTMTAVERHAELVYAETLLEKALLGIVYSGDWLSFLKEALNLRATMNIYTTLGKYIEEVDAAHPSKHDPSLDTHFRSGVGLGVGASQLFMSLTPSKIQGITALFGYRGDRDKALELLMAPGGWSKESDEPGINAEQEGMRRTICDIFLLVFHLVLSSFTFKGVDIDMADKIVRWNLKRYPEGIIFRFGEGRVAFRRSQPAKAIEAYKHAMVVQEQFKSLRFISYWEITIANLALYDIPATIPYWRKLVVEATWSKAVYTYGLAVALLDSVDATVDAAEAEARRKEAAALLAKVPELKQRIAGKSIPLEKFVARRAHRYNTSSTKRLALPTLELAYMLGAAQHAPRGVDASHMLPLTRAASARFTELEKTPSEYVKHGLEGVVAKGKAKEKEEAPTRSSTMSSTNPHKPTSTSVGPPPLDGGYWDDRCLVRFLQGVCARYVAYPDPDAVVEGEDLDVGISEEEAAKEAKECFGDVLRWGTKIELDHHLVYHTHYELGRLLACQQDKAGAKAHFDIVTHGKATELNPMHKRGGKYSMENALNMRTHAATEALEQAERL